MALAPPRWTYTIAFLAVPAAVAAVGAVRRRRRARAARLVELERERTFLRNIMDHAPIGLAALDRELRFMWVNTAFSEKRGWHPENFPGRRLADVFPDAASLLGPPLREALEADACVRFHQVPYRHTPDAPLQYWDTTGVALSDDRGFSGLLLITLNVTERVEQLNKLREVDKLKDHFLSTISHELKTPLSLITGYAELLEDKYPDETLLQGVLDGSRRLVEHLNAVIDYSALLSGSLPLYKTLVCLNEVADHVVALLADDFARKRQHFHLEIAPELPTVYGDVKRLSQILIELVDNARKMTPPHGHLGLSIAPVGNEVQITVWDTGRGIAPEKFAKIWEAFSQLDAEDATRRGGLGLGLTIVKALTDLHDGRTALESDPGHGCRFTVYLPAVPA